MRENLSHDDHAENSNLVYVWQMLGELRGVAEAENADMLCYLIEMAFMEAGDMISRKRNGSNAIAS